MKNESRKKYLLKNTLIFSLGNFGSKFITFFLVPLYTNILTTKKYGTVDLMSVLTTVLVPIISLNISESVMRFSIDEENNRQDILNIGIIITIFSIVLSLFCVPVFNMFSVTSQYSILLSLYIMSFTCSTIFMCYIRGIEKLFDYAVISIIQTIFIALLNILFLLRFKMGIKGYILAYTISYFISTILCVFRGNIYFKNNEFRINQKLLKLMINYSILLIPNALMWWIMNSLDRVMISAMIGIEETGIYAISYKIPSILIAVTNVFNQAWMFSAIKEKNSSDRNVYKNKIFYSLETFVITIALILLIILKPLLSFYVGKSFYGAWRYVPPLLLGTVLLTLATFLSNEYTANKDSCGFLKSSFIGAIVNLMLNFILIDKYRSLGAAIATCLSYFTVFIFRVYDTKKYILIDYRSKKNILNIMMLIIGTLAVYIDNFLFYLIMIFVFFIFFINNLALWKNIFLNFKKILERIKS